MIEVCSANKGRSLDNLKGISLTDESWVELDIKSNDQTTDSYLKEGYLSIDLTSPTMNKRIDIPMMEFDRRAVTNRLGMDSDHVNHLYLNFQLQLQ